jgi:hypothetical protein
MSSLLHRRIFASLASEKGKYTDGLPISQGFVACNWHAEAESLACQ